MSWFKRSKDVILRVVAENPGLGDAALQKKVSEAYPFGQRANYPYKAWLKAVTDVLGPSDKKKAAERAKLAELNRRLGQGSFKDF